MAVYKFKTNSLKTPLKYSSFLAGNDAFDPGAFQSIATTTLSSDTATITFSSIPSTYTHLQIRIMDRNTRSVNGLGGSVRIKFNSDSTSGNYNSHRLLGEPTTVYSGSYVGTTDGAYIAESMSDSATSGIFTATIVDILDYKNTSKYKTTRSLGGGNTNITSGDGAYVFSGLWQSTSAISTITLTVPAYSWKQYSSFALYGIKGA